MFSIIKICLNFAAGPGEEDQDPAGYYTYYDIDNVIHVMDYLVVFEKLAGAPLSWVSPFLKMEPAFTSFNSLPN
jgi:hypothetical protein